MMIPCASSWSTTSFCVYDMLVSHCVFSFFFFSFSFVQGMMTGAYFIGRKELLEWINKLLQLGPQYTKIEQCASGSVYCQILDAMAPGKVNLKKVNFKANQEYQYVENFKGDDKLLHFVFIWK
jgi:hypothetical protein